MTRRLALAVLLLALPARSFADDRLGAPLGAIFSGMWPFKKKPKPAAPAPAGAVVRVVSWNLQTFGKSIKPERKQAAASALAALFAEAGPQVLIAEEIANERGAQTVREMLPEGSRRWTASFENSADGQDNGFFTPKDVHVDCERFVFDAADRSKHPARMAHLHAGDLDFTVIALHLAYDKGDADASVRELRYLLDWLRGYFAKPGSDPDVILAGDFNLPTRKGKAASARASESAWTAIDDVLAEYPEFASGPRRLVALVDDPTSRSGEEAANNYDHFIVSGDLADEELVPGSAGRLPTDAIRAIEAAKGVRVSDHFPIAAQLRMSGAGNDGQPIKLDGSGACTP